MKRLQLHKAPDITVTFDPNVCVHSGVCVRTLPAVFDVRRARWIHADAAGPGPVADTIDRCPSGALQYYRNVERDPLAAYALSAVVAINAIGLALEAEGAREVLAHAVVDAIRAAREYRWVGLYEVLGDEIAAVAWTGDEAPAHPRFSRADGLCGGVVAGRKPVVVNDVALDARYLTTLGSTRAEVVVPILDPATGEVLGTIDVASDQPNAFSEMDVDLLEACARVTAALWES